MTTPEQKDRGGAQDTSPADPPDARMRAEEQAHHIGSRVAAAWYGEHAAGGDPIAVGVVAALAMEASQRDALRRKGRVLEGATEWWQNADDDSVVRALRNIWGSFWIIRPDLARLAGPFAGWLYEEPPREDWVRAAGAAARAAAGAGLLRMGQRELDATDVLGVTYLFMRVDKERQVRGEFYSPPDYCEVMAELQAGSQPLEPGMRIADPAAGMGGMFRALAAVMRRRGLDPADFQWEGNDISPVSVAGLACNSFLWRLGPGVLFGVANTLSGADWRRRETGQVLAVYAEQQAQLRVAGMLALVRGLEQKAAPRAEPAAVPSPAPVREDPPVTGAGAEPAASAADLVLDGSPSAQMALFGDDLPIPKRNPGSGAARRGRSVSGTRRPSGPVPGC